MNYVVEFLKSVAKKDGKTPTVAEYINLNYMGAVTSVRQLKNEYPDDYEKLLDLISAGELLEDEFMRARKPESPKGLTTDALGEELLKQIRRMSPEEKRVLRAYLEFDLLRVCAGTVIQ